MMPGDCMHARHSADYDALQLSLLASTDWCCIACRLQQLQQHNQVARQLLLQRQTPDC
jgi:hypothetical protein